MSYFFTYSGIKYDIMNIKMQDIEIKDIAHSLSLLCRGNGHYKYFYSVAQHCINCYEEAKFRKLGFKLQLACLMHDASEAYIADIISDVKENCHDYIGHEKRLLDKIFEKYSLKLLDSEWKTVLDIDKYVLMCEFQKIQNMPIGETKNKINYHLDFHLRNSKKMERRFLKIFFLLQNLIQTKPNG